MCPITSKEAHDILCARFPDERELERFPFGDLLYRLWSRTDPEGVEYRAHAPKVLAAMNKLLSREPATIMCPDPADCDARILDGVQSEIRPMFDYLDTNAQALFRLGALYHDIGKYIIKERHPTIGWYTLEYANPDQRDDLRSLLGGREEYLQLLMILIRDHDQFGVLCTGEASYPILLRAATSLGSSLDDQKRVLSAMMWLNLADMAGTIGLELESSDLEKLIEDWRWIIKALEPSPDDKRRFDDRVIEEASREEMVEKRICRLLLESSRKVPKRLAELNQRSGMGSDPAVVQLVRRQLGTVYPTAVPRRMFGTQFAHVCKLDYGKRFFEAVVQYCEGPSIPGKWEQPLKVYAAERKDTPDLIYAVLAILRRITSTYAAMIDAADKESGRGNLIGVEMKDLTPRNAPEKPAHIIDLLLKSHYPGLSWMISDVPAWYF